VSIDTTFKPLLPTVSLPAATAIQVVPAGLVASGVVSFRISNITTTAAVIGWGTTATNATDTAAAAGAPQNAMTIAGTPGQSVVYLELPYNTFFLTSAISVFEVTPGMGGSH
jgi:hypothetical protein